MEDTKQYPAAAVMGRFQPLHNEHMDYLTAAAARCAHLWIGITRFLPSRENRGGSHRGLQAENPLTYFEHVVLITDALVSAGFSRDQFTCIPFPLDEPELLPHCLATTIPCLTTLCETWNVQKKEILQECGYEVEVLYHNEERRITGQGIRNAIRQGDDRWHNLVPATVRDTLISWNLADRLRQLETSD